MHWLKCLTATILHKNVRLNVREQKNAIKNPPSKMSDTEKLKCRNLSTEIPAVNNSMKKKNRRHEFCFQR